MFRLSLWPSRALDKSSSLSGRASAALPPNRNNRAAPTRAAAFDFSPSSSAFAKQLCWRWSHMENRKKQSDSVLDNPMRTPGSGNNPSVTAQHVQGAMESLGPMKRFRCADVGFRDCKWQAEGRSEEDLM